MLKEYPGLGRVTEWLRTSATSPCLLDHACYLRLCLTNYIIWNKRKL